MTQAPASLQLLDTVALTTDLPDHHLIAGQVGTIVEQLAPAVFEVEFSDDDGQTYAMLPLAQHQLLRLVYAPVAASRTAVYQSHSGNGDNVGGDKVMGDKVARDKVSSQYTTHLPQAQIGNFANQVSGQAQQQVGNLTQTSGATTAELLALVAQLRDTATQFPAEVQDDLTIDIDDVEVEIQKPESQRNPAKLRKRLVALMMAAGAIAAPVAATTDFTNNILDIGEKVGIELPQLPLAP
ncbi:MAG: DUF4926 domain-containing protein [Cyanobacteria bacterium J06638_20]